MKQAKHIMRAFALLIALSVLPLFITSNNIRGADSSRLGSLYPEALSRHNKTAVFSHREYGCYFYYAESLYFS